MGEDGGRAGSEGPSRARLGVALAAAVLLAGLTAIILLASSSGDSGEGAASPAPNNCLKAWNSDQQAIDFGRHNSVSHGYTDVEIGYMPEEGSASLSTEAAAGECAVVFAANELDPEELAAGQIHGAGGWAPLSGFIESADLAELQSAAVGGANAIVTEQGNLIRK
jgi:hypothetical protein